MANNYSKITPSDAAFNSLYLFNLINVAGMKMHGNSMIRVNQKFNNYAEASQKDTRLAALINSLKPEQVELLINRIEENQ